MEQLLDLLKPVVEGGAVSYPLLAKVLIFIGGMRVVFKPLVSLLQAIVSITPSQSDDSFVAKVMESKAYKWLSFALDYSSSIKLPQVPKDQV